MENPEDTASQPANVVIVTLHLDGLQVRHLIAQP